MAACEIGIHFHPKDGKITALDKKYDKLMVWMYNQYADRLVEETREWRALLARRAHFAYMRDQLEKMEEGVLEAESAMEDLQNLESDML